MEELLAAGAAVNAAFVGSHSETPLRWAASTDDIAVLGVLLLHGANLEASGDVIGGGTKLSDAVAFGQWRAARLLIERGAETTLWQAAALGLMTRVAAYFADAARPGRDDITNAFLCACHGGQREAAEYLLTRGAELSWAGHGGLTSLEAASLSGAEKLADWLRRRGAASTRSQTE